MNNKRRLSKRKLAGILGYVSGSGKSVYYHRMKKEILTEEFIQATGITRKKYASTCVFSPEQSLKIISFFQIEEEELVH